MSKGKTIMVIDGGGRGAVLVDKYAQSHHVEKIIAVPGNDLMQVNTKKPVQIYPHLKTTSKDEILEIAKKEKADLIDVAQDNAVEAGVSDILRENGFKVVGASKDSGQLEWDKAFSRDFMVKFNLPIPKYWIFNNPKEAKEFLESQKEKPFVIKAAGLAEGKGVIIAQNIAQALDAVEEMARFGKSGEKFLIEEFLDGEEFSSYAISDGKTFQYIASAQDHKRVFDNDEGPNTGGMGCSTPSLVVDSKIEKQIMDIFEKTFEGLKSENKPYQGILYLGGIVVPPRHPKRPSEGATVFIIEFNARWGDPEVECILPGIKNDWFEVGIAVSEGNLKEKIEYDGKSRIVVAAASKGYPGDYSAVKGKEIKGLDKLLKMNDIKVYGAGVKVLPRHPERPSEGSKFIASGGRLFYVVSEGKGVIEAREKAYNALKEVNIEGGNLHYRTDIGYRDVARLKA